MANPLPFACSLVGQLASLYCEIALKGSPLADPMKAKLSQAQKHFTRYTENKL